MSDTIRDEEFYLKAKRGFLTAMIQRRFEDNMYEYFSKHDFDTIEELDAFLDKELKRYYSDTDAVRSYYDSKLYS